MKVAEHFKAEWSATHCTKKFCGYLQEYAPKKIKGVLQNL